MGNVEKVVGYAATFVVCSLTLVSMMGCISSMTALDSDIPKCQATPRKGMYSIAHVSASPLELGADEIISALSKDATYNAMFNGDAKDTNVLPVDIAVECSSRGANGGIALVNNIFALCTLTIWPYVSANQCDYKVTVSTVVGSHEVCFKMLNRTWFGLSPFAAIPVPGWSDERGDAEDIAKFHRQQIVEAVKAAFVSLPNDYDAFIKDHSKYVEQISQISSEEAFNNFKRGETVDAKLAGLMSMVNKSTIDKHQNDLVRAFKSIKNGAIRAAIVTKLNDSSIGELPYDKVLVAYWSHVSDKRVLAQIYRNCFDALSDSDRTAIIAKIGDEKILTEIACPPSSAEIERLENGRKSKERDIVYEIARLDEAAKVYYLQRLNDRAEEAMKKVADMRNELAAIKNDFDVYGLYTTNAVARIVIYKQMTAATLKTIAERALAEHRLVDWSSGKIESLEAIADMSSATSDSAIAHEIAMALAGKVVGYKCERRQYWMGWEKDDIDRWNKLKGRFVQSLSGEILASMVRKDNSLWDSASLLVIDQEILSAMAYELLVKSVNGGNGTEINDAWVKYGYAITDDNQLMDIAVKVVSLRKDAFAKIKSDAVKKQAQAAIDAELARIAAIRREKIKKIIPIAESEANDILLLFAKIGMNSNQLDAFKRMYCGRVLIFRKATVRNNNCSSNNNAHRVLMMAAYSSKELINPNKSIDFYADFWDEFKKNSRKLEEYKKADVVTIVKEGNSFCFFTNAAVLDGQNDAAIIEAFLNDCEVSDETLDAMLAGASDRTVLKLANEFDIEFPTASPLAQP